VDGHRVSERGIARHERMGWGGVRRRRSIGTDVIKSVKWFGSLGQKGGDYVTQVLGRAQNESSPRTRPPRWQQKVRRRGTTPVSRGLKRWYVPGQASRIAGSAVRGSDALKGKDLCDGAEGIRKPQLTRRKRYAKSAAMKGRAMD